MSIRHDLRIGLKGRIQMQRKIDGSLPGQRLSNDDARFVRQQFDHIAVCRYFGHFRNAPEIPFPVKGRWKLQSAEPLLIIQ